MRGSLRPFLIKLAMFVVFTTGVTAMLAAVIGNVQPFTDFYTIKAEFTDATGLLRNDLVKIAGVNVGKVTGAEVHDGKALVSLQIRKTVTLPRSVRASIRYRNLLGVRYIQILRDPAAPQSPRLSPGDTIPVAQTSPAVDLGVIFNNLKPVLAALSPEDANIVSRAVVRIFTGREAKMQKLVSDLADLSQTLGDKGPVAAQLIVDLGDVVGNLASHDRELRSILTSFDQLLTSLAARSDELGRAVTTVGSASNTLTDLVQANRPGLDQAIAQLTEILDLVEQHKAGLDKTLVELSGPSGAVHGLSRATTWGEWANLMVVCLDGQGPSCPRRSAATSAGLADIFRSAVPS